MPNQFTLESGAPTAMATVALVGSGAFTILAANSNRAALRIANGGTVPLFLGYGATAVASQGFPVAPSSVIHEPDFNGLVSACAPGGTVAVYVVDIYGTGF